MSRVKCIKNKAKLFVRGFPLQKEYGIEWVTGNFQETGKYNTGILIYEHSGMVINIGNVLNYP